MVVWVVRVVWDVGKTGQGGKTRQSGKTGQGSKGDQSSLVGLDSMASYIVFQIFSKKLKKYEN